MQLVLEVGDILSAAPSGGRLVPLPTAVPESEIGAVYDIGELTTEIAEAAQRAASSNYPMLTPGRTGGK